MMTSRRTHTVLLVLIMATGLAIVAMLASDARGWAAGPAGAAGIDERRA